MGDIEAPACTACAACCTSHSARHVRVTGADWSRLGDEAEGLTLWLANQVFMRMDGERCAALQRVGGAFSCSIYERRPEICRELARGSPACEAERVTKSSLPIWRAG